MVERFDGDNESFPTFLLSLRLFALSWLFLEFLSWIVLNGVEVGVAVREVISSWL